ncbi:MAG: hypothetical protein RLZ55_1689 [Actinomycetota bacterium]|jgi:hypothetical protein
MTDAEHKTSGAPSTSEAASTANINAAAGLGWPTAAGTGGQGPRQQPAEQWSGPGLGWPMNADALRHPADGHDEEESQ